MLTQEEIEAREHRKERELHARLTAEHNEALTRVTGVRHNYETCIQPESEL